MRIDHQALGRRFLEQGWVKVDLPRPGIVAETARAALAYLNRRFRVRLKRLEDYHTVFADDAAHLEAQAAVAEHYWQQKMGPAILAEQLELLRGLIGLDLHVQHYPYLRIARPAKPQDNIALHRDTHYGATAHEVSVWVPLVDVGPAGALSVVPGSHLESDAAYPHRRIDSAEVAKGSVRHKLGVPYAPHRILTDLSGRTRAVPARRGQALVIALSLIHGQAVNRARTTRFSTDIRVVNSQAPIPWSRNVRADFYVPLCTSPVLAQAQAYEAANRAAGRSGEQPPPNA